MAGILNDLQYRDLIYQASNLKGLGKRLKKGKTVIYCGFDATAESLQAGNLVPMLVLKRFQLAGHQPIILVGGGTSLIGDPGGKKQERPLQQKEKVKKQAEKIKKQCERFLDFKAKNNPALILNNYDWLAKERMIDFLREIGKNFTISSMLAKETIKNRLESGISFTEFSYMLLQAYDFFHLKQKYACDLQIGGSDQWGNITAGIDLIRKKLETEVFGFTVPLVVTADGTKFGKTEKGTIWLDSRLTSPYKFYQFWLNTDDRDIVKFLKYFTFLNKDKINDLAKNLEKEPEKRKAQKALAGEITELIHGKEALASAEKISQALFYGNLSDLTLKELEMAFDDVPSFSIKGLKKIFLVDFLVSSGICSSKRQAREDINNGIIFINAKKYQDLDREISLADCLFEKYLIIKKGKKNYFLVRWFQ